jgi:O-antigen ligase
MLRQGGVTISSATAVCLGFMLMLTLGLGVTESRAGVLLGVAAIICSLVLIVRARDTPGNRWLSVSVGGAAVMGAALVAVFSLSGLAARFEMKGAMDNGRTGTFPIISKAALSFWPFGAGLGSFVPVYKIFEPNDAVSGFYLNHAHDDYLELWLEGGLPALLLAVGALAWIAWAASRAWRRAFDGDAHLARAGSIAAAMLLIHSLFDYPLRTAALAALFGVACGLLVPPPQLRSGQQAHPHR